MGVRLGHNPNYIWRSIHASHVVVIMGARWKVGNGKLVKVWVDEWLRGAIVLLF